MKYNRALDYILAGVTAQKQGKIKVAAAFYKKAVRHPGLIEAVSFLEAVNRGTHSIAVESSKFQKTTADTPDSLEDELENQDLFKDKDEEEYLEHVEHSADDEEEHEVEELEKEGEEEETGADELDEEVEEEIKEGHEEESEVELDEGITPPEDEAEKLMDPKFPNFSNSILARVRRARQIANAKKLAATAGKKKAASKKTK